MFKGLLKVKSEQNKSSCCKIGGNYLPDESAIEI